MSRAIYRQQSPQQHQLNQKRLELFALRAALLARERSLDALRSQLHSFEGRYIRQVGVLYKQLDEWERKIAELDSPLIIPEGVASQDEELNGAASDTEEQTGAPGAPIDLKLLFRELAKRVHPDFASDPADAQLRTLLMAQANDAYKRQDAGMLQRMLHGRDTADAPEDTAAELALVLEQLGAVAASISHVEAATEALAHSELAKLRERTLSAAEKGQDLLSEMAARVKGNIGMAMRRYELDLVRKKRKEPAFDPTPFVSAETSPA